MSGQPQPGFAMGVDLGTSNTVAVVRWPDGRTRPLLVDGAPIMPSGVYADDAGRLHVGRDAERLAQLEPARFEPNPKRRIDEPGVLLGDREVSTVDLLAAVLGAVARTAVEAAGFLPPAVLTYPAAWGSRRRETLATAAVRAGWPPPWLVPEPVAAARYFADVLRRPVPVGSSLAVFDFGGGTLDVAVVRNNGGRFEVLGSGGIEDLGGLDVDAALVDHIGRVIGPSAPAAWGALSNPDGPTERRNRRLFWEDVRGAKEMLSRVAVAPVTVPGVDHAVHLTREELERVAAPLLRRGVQQTATVIRDCGLRPDELAGLFLVGGSSRLPLVARMLHADLGIAPTVLEQPELPVAEGAIAELIPPPAAAPTSPNAAPGWVAASASAPVSATPVSPVPVGQTSPAAYAAWPVTAPPAEYGSPQPPAARGVAAVDYGARPPAPPGPTSLGARTGPPAPPSAPPTDAAPPTEAGAGLPMGRPRLRRPASWIIATAVAAVLALVAVVAVVWWRRERPVTFTALASMPVAVPFGEDPISEAYSYTVGDRAYVAWHRGQTMEVAGIDLANQQKLWQTTLPGTSQNWRGITAAPDALLAFDYNYSDAELRPMYVLNPGDGRKRWQRDVYGSDYRIYLASALVLVSPKDHVIRGLDWRNGNQKWSLPDRVSDSSPVNTRTFQITIDKDVVGPAAFAGWPYGPGRAEGRLIQLDSEKTLRVVDANTGEVTGERKGVADVDDVVFARDDKLYVVTSGSGYEIREYDLTNLGEPRVVYSEPDTTRRALALERCGDAQLCALEQKSSDAKSTGVVAIDLTDRRFRWRQPAPGTEQLVPVGDRVLATTDQGEPASALFDPKGKQLLSGDDRQTVGVRINSGSILLFSDIPSTYPTSVAVTGVSAGDGKRQPLGSLERVRSRSCSWSRAYVVCAIDKEFKVWRFAET